ncbi:hypothetical protein V8F06_010972 [Rhypophila decipiens]
MRLINTNTLKLEEYSENPPLYCILSHTWELDDEEVSFHDLQTYHKGDETITKRGGFEKIRQTARIAKERGYSYIWVDTCCIDKTNSAELSKALNSMFAWYKASAFCIAYLSDVRTSYHAVEFRKARWFTRGWTLPELIAPRKVLFYDQDWHFIGSKSERLSEIAQITGIDPFVLGGGDVGQVSVARRMFWASKRRTTRPEDMAYCLLGVFNIYIPPFYGEGEFHAFERLQLELISTTDGHDQSLYAWQNEIDWQSPELRPGVAWEHDDEDLFTTRDLMDKARLTLAKSPADFERCGSMFPALGLDYRPTVQLVQDKDDHQVDLDEESQWETMSIMSTTSTLVESVEDETASRGLFHAISFLQDDPDISPLLQPAFLELGSEKFQRILARLLCFMATELTSEAKNKEESSVAAFLRRHRLLISSAITNGLVKTREEGPKAESGSKGEHSHPIRDEPDDPVIQDDDVDEENIADEEPEDKEEGETAEADREETDFDFLPFDNFILSSRAHQQLITRLRDLAYPLFRARAWNLSARVLKSQASKDWAPEYKDCMKSVMALVVSEFIFSRPSAVCVEDENPLSAIEQTQLWLESRTGQAWNWWPLQSPRPRVQDGEARLGWSCTCGDKRWVVVPTEFAHKMSHLVKKYPIKKTHPNNSTTIPGKPGAVISTGGVPLPAPAVTPIEHTVQGKPAGNTDQIHTVSSTVPIAAPAYSPNIQQQPSIPQARFLFMVGKYGRYRLDELLSLHLNTEEFAHHLRSTYLTRKGLWKRWLSMYGFSHCNFGKFQRYRRNGYSHKGYGLPERAKKEYYYTPTSWEPPISPEEFKHLYQHAASRHSGWVRRILNSWSSKTAGLLPTAHQQQHEPRPDPDDEDYDGDIPTDSVDRIPQRYWNINKTLNVREDFWGILIQERRSAVMTALYTLLTLSPFLTFCILYLLGIVQGDVQNATTPLAISLTAFSLLLGLIIKQ